MGLCRLNPSAGLPGLHGEHGPKLALDSLRAGSSKGRVIHASGRAPIAIRHAAGGTSGGGSMGGGPSGG
jgi:hypothetical protein